MPLRILEADTVTLLTDGAQRLEFSTASIDVYASIEALENAVRASDELLVGGYYWHKPFSKIKVWFGPESEPFFCWLQDFLGHKEEVRWALYHDKFRVLTFSEICEGLRRTLLPFR